MVDHVEEDDFVLIENADGDEEDAVSVSSSRSSQVMVDDPSKDVLMMHGESPVRSVVLPLAPSDAERAPTEPLQPPCTEADGPHEEAMKEEVRALAAYNSATLLHITAFFFTVACGAKICMGRLWTQVMLYRGKGLSISYSQCSK